MGLQVSSWVGFELLASIEIVELLSCSRGILTWFELWFEMTLCGFFRLVDSPRDGDMKVRPFFIRFGCQDGRTGNEATVEAAWRKARVAWDLYPARSPSQAYF